MLLSAPAADRRCGPLLVSLLAVGCVLIISSGRDSLSPSTELAAGLPPAVPHTGNVGTARLMVPGERGGPRDFRRVGPPPAALNGEGPPGHNPRPIGRLTALFSGVSALCGVGAALTLAVRKSLPSRQPGEPHGGGRRGALASLVAAAAAPLLVPPAADAIVGGADVSAAEAASVGAVGLYIDLAGCTVCRKDVPATCSGTLIAPNLVLSAKHCIDISTQLNAKLTKIVFSPNLLDPNAPAREVDKVVSTTDYGIDLQGNDLVLIRIKGTAPEPWRPVQLPLRLLPREAELPEAEQTSRLVGLGTPQMAAYGYGETKWDTRPEDYTSGRLKRIIIQVISEVRPWAPGFLTAPVDPESGTCAGDSGGAAIMGLLSPTVGPPRTLLMGVQAAAELPCRANRAIYIYPDTFTEFLEKASADLGTPLTSQLSWRDYAS